MENTKIEFKNLPEKPEFEYCSEYDFGKNYSDKDNIRANFFHSVCEGRKTEVFGYLVLPENTEGKVPAVVLVHGGGGTAFDDWVKLWTDRGYAALAIDTEGNVPVKGNFMDFQEHAKSPYYGKPNSRFQDNVSE